MSAAAYQAWQWLAPEVLLAVHEEQLAEHGGAAGLRDAGLFESALARPRQLATYGEPDAADLAAAYAFDLVRNHLFVDGNKRTGYVAAELFLMLNGYATTASDESATLATLSLAAGELPEAALADWLRRHVQPCPQALQTSFRSQEKPTMTSTAAAARPFKILGVQQIAIGGPDKNRLRKLWVDIFGLTVKSTFLSERENVDEDICALGSGPTAVEVDLMQPVDAEKKPAVHATPLNHIGLWVDDLPKAVAWLGANGVRFAPGGIRKGAAGYDICFIHPKGNDEFPLGGEGVLIELVQAPPEVIAALG